MRQFRFEFISLLGKFVCLLSYNNRFWRVHGRTLKEYRLFFVALLEWCVRIGKIITLRSLNFNRFCCSTQSYSRMCEMVKAKVATQNTIIVSAQTASFLSTRCFRFNVSWTIFLLLLLSQMEKTEFMERNCIFQSDSFFD